MTGWEALKHKKFHFKKRKNFFFIVKLIKHWNRLYRKFPESPSLELFKIQRDAKFCASGSNWAYFEQVGWTKQSPEISDNLSCIVSDFMKLDSSVLMLRSIQLECGKLSSKNYSSRKFGHLTNWSCSTNKDCWETQQQRERSILLGW